MHPTLLLPADTDFPRSRRPALDPLRDKRVHRGIRSVAGMANVCADPPADAPADRERLRAGQVAVVCTDDDWTLNDLR